MANIELTRTRLLITLGLLLILGIALSISNAYCAINMGHLYSPFLYGIAIIAFATGSAVTLLFQWKINRIQLEKVINILPEDEKIVVRIIAEKKSITQTDLRHMSNISKVKLSRIIKRLEQRKIIEKKMYGNTNLIISSI